jgi:hypothetical protein
MRATMVQRHEIEAGRKGRREGIDEELEAFSVQRGQVQEEPVAGRRLHRAIDLAPFEDLVHAPDGLHAAGREAPAAHGQQAEAAVILAQHPDRAGIRGGDHPLEVVTASSLEGWNRLRICLCARAGPL